MPKFGSAQPFADELDRMQAQLAAHRQLLTEIAKTLYGWARESQGGGWSTHQVEPQKQLAGKINEFLSR